MPDQPNPGFLFGEEEKLSCGHGISKLAYRCGECHPAKTAGKLVHKETHDQVQGSLDVLRDAIKEHMDERGHDRCWESDVKLYVKAGLMPPSTPLWPVIQEHRRKCDEYRAGKYGCKVENEPTQMVQELAMLIRQMITYKRSEASIESAKIYLRDHGLNGNILRSKLHERYMVTKQKERWAIFDSQLMELVVDFDKQEEAEEECSRLNIEEAAK